jgi:hypothetical protein
MQMSIARRPGFYPELEVVPPVCFGCGLMRYVASVKDRTWQNLGRTANQ